MAKSETKKMTIAYWNGLSEGSRRRALTYVFPIHPACVDMLLNDKPKPKDPWWRMVWDQVRIPRDNTHYKTVINNRTYLA